MGVRDVSVLKGGLQGMSKETFWILALNFGQHDNCPSFGEFRN